MLKCLVISVIALSATLAPMIAQQRTWEEMESTLVVNTEIVEGQDVLDISVKDGYVYVTTSKPVTVKLFSILGQLISQHEVKQGTWRMKIPARGIYILKAGAVTRRITI